MRSKAFTTPLWVLFFVFLGSSCASNRGIVYLEDMAPLQEYQTLFKRGALIKPQDNLRISVSSNTPDLSLPFNIDGGSYSIKQTGELDKYPQSTKSEDRRNLYQVSQEGTIDFPVLGTLQVADLSLTQLKELIKQKLIEGKYIPDPIVQAEFSQFKFYVMGAVKKVGEFTTEGNRVTLLEALAMAGDLEPRARIDKVVVYRESGDNYIAFPHDLRSREIFSSPGFYLQKNDVVYVQPRYLRSNRDERISRYIALGLSSTSTLLAIIVFFRK